jgi:hypothetical protein
MKRRPSRATSSVFSTQNARRFFKSLSGSEARLYGTWRREQLVDTMIFLLVDGSGNIFEEFQRLAEIGGQTFLPSTTPAMRRFPLR